MLKPKFFLYLGATALCFHVTPSFGESLRCLQAADNVLSKLAASQDLLLEMNRDLQRIRLGRDRVRVPSLQSLSSELNEAIDSFPKNLEAADQDPGLLAVVRKILFSKSPKPEDREILLPKKDPRYLQAAQGALKFRSIQKNISEWTASTFRLIRGQESKWFHFYKSEDPKEFFEYLYWDVAHRGFQTISPFPLPANRAPTASIFRKLWRNSSYVPTLDEIETLKKFDALTLFEDQRAFQLRNPTVSAVRRWMGNAAELVKFLSFTALGIHAYEISQGGFVTVDEFLAEPRSRTGNEIFLLVDTVPFPHLALMMNNKVYTYGQTHLTVQDPVIYLKDRQVHQIMKARGLLNNTDEQPSKAAPEGLGSSGEETLQSLLKNTGLDRLPRSMEVVSLRLSGEELDQVGRELESHRAMRYQNFTMVNDCATMIIRVLSKNTWIGSMRLVDASPSQIIMSFSAQKLAGEKRVTRVFQMTTENDEDTDKQFARNLWINAMESKLFISFFWVNQIHRLILDASLLNKLQTYDSATLDIINREWYEDAMRDIESDEQIALFEEQSVNLKSVKDPELLRETFESYFSETCQKLREGARSGATDLRDRTVNEYKIELLKSKHAKIKSRIDAFLDPGVQ